MRLPLMFTVAPARRDTWSPLDRRIRVGGAAARLAARGGEGAPRSASMARPDRHADRTSSRSTSKRKSTDGQSGDLTPRLPRSRPAGAAIPAGEDDFTSCTR